MREHLERPASHPSASVSHLCNGLLGETLGPLEGGGQGTQGAGMGSTVYVWVTMLLWA